MIPLGIYADIDFCNQISDWNLQLLKIVQDVNSVYNTHLNTRLLIRDGPRCIPGSDAWSNDATYGPGKLFTQYSQWCAGDNGCSAVRNALGIAHLVSGKNLVQGSQDIIGAGDEPGTFSVIEALYQWLTSYTRKVLASHEMGHNLWGDHGYHESWWDWGCFDTARTIMGPSSFDCQWKDWFSAANRKGIVGRVRGVMGNWLPFLEQSSTSSDGFYVAKWWIRYSRIANLNGWADFHFLLVNPTGGPATFDYIFVGCRNGPNQGTNCDFGYTGQITIPSGGSYEFTASRQLTVTGVWQFWPAYRYQGHWGPYKWEVIEVPVVNVQVGSYAGPDTSPAGVRLRNFRVWAASSTVRAGDILTVEYRYENTLSSNMDFDPYGVLVGARDPSGANKDFGHTLMRLWGDGQTGCNMCPADAYTVMTASIKVTSSGTWTFWPAYYLNGGWGPYQWHAITVSVQP